MKTMKIKALHPVLLVLAATVLLAPGRAADAPVAMPPPWQHQDIGSAQVGHKVPAVPVEKFGKNALFGKSGLIAGTATQADRVFTLQGTMDIWGPMDGGHFVWQPVQGDFVFVARVTSMDNPGGNKHAKAGLCLREALEGGSRNVAQCITPVDGTQFLYRETTDDKTVRIFPDAAAPRPSVPKETFPCWLKLVRSGNAFSGYESLDGETWWLTGTLKLDLKADALLGLTSSSHTTNTLTTSVFDHVQLSTPKAGAGTKAAKDRRAQLMTIGIDGSDKRLIYETTTSLEAPNWSPDGKWLVCNGGGALWRITADGSGQPEKILAGDVQKVNNDHVLAPNGKTIYFSAAGHLYAVPFAGGQPRRVSNDQPPARQFKYFLHGVSPDEQTLAYVGVESANGDPWGRMDLFTIPTAGGADTRLTNTPAPDDGPEYSSDGKWIYFNSELNAQIPGHAQCYRMKPDGTGIEQLTHDERVNWFPHVSPDGKWIVYISFPPGTVKHPADKDVILRRMRPDGSEQADIIAFNGGQGTINVNSWSPDSQRFAFVMYPKAGETPVPTSKPSPQTKIETKHRPQVVAFDAVETLFPLEPMRARFHALGLPDDALELWFARLLRNAFALDASGTFKTFGEVARATLEVMLAEHHLPADAEAVKQALGGLAELPVHPDVAPAFQWLHENGIRVVVLTNGNADNTRKLLQRAGLTGLVERIISIDEIRRWKPSREIYLHAARVCEVAPDQLALVAAHARDVHGASQAGLVTGWVSRLEKHYLTGMNPPDATGDTLVEVSRQLAGLPPASQDSTERQHR